MSISLAVPAVTDVSATGLSAVTAISLAAPLLSNAGAPSASLTALSPGISVPTDAATGFLSTVGGLDPLTPQSVTASATAALTTVIGSVTSTLDTLPNGAGQGANAGVSRLFQSQGFQLLFQALGTSGDSSESSGQNSSSQLGALLSGSATSASSATTTASNAPATGSQDKTAPYFHKLLGELAGTFGALPSADGTSASATSGAGGISSTFNSSEIDLFLQWLSLHGNPGTVASA